jgi:hypothetical protein
LLRFRTANVRSLRDEQELSFVAAPRRRARPPDPVTSSPGEFEITEQYAEVAEEEPSAVARETRLGGDRSADVYPLLGIFGANASGKSNVLRALADMRAAVLNSYARWASFEGIPRKPFRLDAKCEGEPAFFEADLVLDEVRWTYGFELGPTRVEAEWLHSYPRGHRQVWLDREAARAEPYEWPGARIKDRLQLARRTRPDALLLSTAGTDNHPQLSPLFHWFRRNLWLIDPENERTERERFTTDELSGVRAHRINELLRVADLGITGAEVVRTSASGTEVRLTHRTAAEEAALDWQDESLGTRSWYALLGPLLLALDQGAVLLVDELDASLHSRFAAEVIRLFHDPQANPKGAQLLFTAHDPSVLSTPSGGRLLEPGQVWLTEKDKDGATELYPLTAASPGADEDLTKSYLAGAFGAVPALLEGQISRRLLAVTAAAHN